jgi:CDP-diacylglycerol---serine O-phosphatidyltransferase
VDPGMSLHDVPTTTPERRGLRRGVFLLPSLFTVANLFCGWACVVYAMRGEFHTAAPFIGFAVVLDMLDGRIARMTGSSSAFGVEFDSMADLISFGMAPAALTFQWGLQPLGRLGWAVGFLYLAAAAVRLARFNIQHVTDKRYFVGMPSPSAAGVPAATIFFVGEGLTERGPALLALVMLVVPALLMVSTFRFRSMKTMNLSSPVNSKVLIVVAAAIALFTTSPDVVLLVLAYGYLVSPIIEWAATRGSRKAAPVAAQGLVDAPPETPPEATAHREL